MFSAGSILVTLLFPAVPGLQLGLRGDSHPRTPPARHTPGERFLYKTLHPDRQVWGDRLLAAAAVANATSGCGGFVSFGDFTWCANAMPRETDFAKMNHDVTGMVFEAWNPKSASLGAGDEFMAISYGIRERDLWSEFMSNRFGVPTQLYDCFWKFDEGPMGTKSFSVQSVEQENRKYKYQQPAKGHCPDWRDGVCFEAPYEPKKVCVDSVAHEVVDAEKRHLVFETLHDGLQDRPPLSTFMKIDVEGSEWDVLEQLLDSEEDMGKIRSLDMEVHLNMYRDSSGKNHNIAHMEKKVRVMERLAERFAVVASSVGTLHANAERNQRRELAKKPETLFPEPEAAYNTKGFTMDQYCISFVNRALL